VLDYVVYRLTAIAAILFYWITMKVVRQLTCLTLGRPNGPAYSTGELLNTPQIGLKIWSVNVASFVAMSYAKARLSDRRHVCLSVCLSHARINSELMTIGSCGFHHLGLYTRLGVATNDEKNGDFRSVSRYVSETIKDRHIITCIVED